MFSRLCANDRKQRSALGVYSFDTCNLPDGVLLKACGSRRETVCPPCASLYRGDAFALVASGLKGGKEVPESIGEHPTRGGRWRIPIGTDLQGQCNCR